MDRIKDGWNKWRARHGAEQRDGRWKGWSGRLDRRVAGRRDGEDGLRQVMVKALKPCEAPDSPRHLQAASEDNPKDGRGRTI